MTTTWETKDSGERAEFDSGMQRDTESGKPRFDLLVPDGIPYTDQLLTRFAGLLGRGAEKYTERNWEQANSETELARMRSSAFRHFMQWFCGETDEDHAAATMFNLMAYEATAYKIRREAQLGAFMADHLEDMADPEYAAAFEGLQALLDEPSPFTLRVVAEDEDQDDAQEATSAPSPAHWEVGGTETHPVVVHAPAWRVGRDYLNQVQHLHTVVGDEERCVKNRFAARPCDTQEHVGGGV